MLGLFALLLVACEDDAPHPPARVQSVPASAAPTTVGTSDTPEIAPTLAASVASAPRTSPELTASAAGQASAAASEAAPLPAGAGLLAEIVNASEIKITRFDTGKDAVVVDGAHLRTLLEGLGLAQKPAEACPRGTPAFTLSFKDRYGKRLGSVTTFSTKEGGAIEREAAVNDALGERCQGITLDDPEGFVKKVRAASVEAG